MKRKQIFHQILKLFYWFCKAFGVCPFYYDSSSESFNWTKWDIFYSIFIWANFSYFYPTSGLNVVAHLSPLVVIAFFYLAMTTITIVITMQCWNVKKLTILMNETMWLFEELLPFCSSISTGQAVRYGIWFVGKIFITSGLAQIASINCCTIICKTMLGKVDYFVIFIVSVAYFLQTLVPNMFYTFILGISIQYHQLSGEIKKIVRQNNFMMKNNCANDFFDMLNKRLNYIASLHGKLTIHALKVNKIFSWQLLIMITNFVAIILIEVRF